MRLITHDELLAMADVDIHPAIERMLGFPGTDGLVVYECLDLGSPEIGQKSFMTFGPERTYKTLEQCYAGHLGDVPSRFRHPVAHYLNPPQEQPCLPT